MILITMGRSKGKATKKAEYTKDELRNLTAAKIQEIDVDIEIYTDGSTSG